jgi:hypothetical protein
VVPTAGNPKRTVRMSDEDWSLFEDACRRTGVQPAVMMRTLIEWYCRRPGVTVVRPPAPGKAD